MEFAKFNQFWHLWTSSWYDKSKIIEGEKVIRICELCHFKPNISRIVYKKYCSIKTATKELYFIDSKSKKLNRYKRAAVIAYAILESNPLEYTYSRPYYIDSYMLKQRLAFMVAIGSILQDYSEKQVSQLDKPIFRFSSLDDNDLEDEDSFLTTVYKDMLFSEAYGNYNILTMANVFKLLTEKSSLLSEIKPLPE